MPLAPRDIFLLPNLHCYMLLVSSQRVAVDQVSPVFAHAHLLMYSTEGNCQVVVMLSCSNSNSSMCFVSVHCNMMIVQ